MAKIEIYTTQMCPFCTAAKNLLREKNAAFSEINVGADRALRDAMQAQDTTAVSDCLMYEFPTTTRRFAETLAATDAFLVSLGYLPAK